jgi:cytochrome c-type biogenesis protein CcmH/NrfF
VGAGGIRRHGVGEPEAHSVRVLTVLWITASGLLLLALIIAGWRLRRAAHTVNRILAEELESSGDEASEEEVEPTSRLPDR